MTKSSTLFLICLLSINFIASLKLSPIEASLLPDKSIKTQLTQILMKVQQEDQPKTISKFLQQVKDILTRLQAEQDEHKRISDKMLAQCLEEEEFRSKELNDAQDALKRATKSREDHEASLEASKKDLPELELARTNYAEELERIIKQRADDHQRYVERQRNYAEGIALFADFIPYVESNLKLDSATLVQKSEIILKHASKMGRLTDAVPVLVALAQNKFGAEGENKAYSATRDKVLGQKLHEALKTLNAKIIADNQLNETNEEQGVVAFNLQKNKIEEALNTLDGHINATKSHIDAMTLAIKDEDEIIVKAGSKASRNQELKDSADKMCNDFATEFTVATKNREEEIQTIREIVIIIEKRFGKIPNDLHVYLESVENGWKEYINSTDFHKYVDYEHRITTKSTRAVVR
jgi:hypothetical protein